MQIAASMEAYTRVPPRIADTRNEVLRYNLCWWYKPNPLALKRRGRGVKTALKLR